MDTAALSTVDRRGDDGQPSADTVFEDSYPRGSEDATPHALDVDTGNGDGDWFVDDTEFLRLRPGDQPPGAPWAYDHPFFLILNLAVGGNYVAARMKFPKVFDAYIKANQNKSKGE
jgi:hypothetical protein